MKDGCFVVLCTGCLFYTLTAIWPDRPVQIFRETVSGVVALMLLAIQASDLIRQRIIYRQELWRRWRDSRLTAVVSMGVEAIGLMGLARFCLVSFAWVFPTTRAVSEPILLWLAMSAVVILFVMMCAFLWQSVLAQSH